MAYNNLKLEQEGGILTIYINREDKMNALNIETIEEIKTAFQKVYDDSSIMAVIVTGTGEKAFVAGADIAELSELSEVNGRNFAENGQEVFQMIENCHKPVIAAVNGFALGGGCELALACHMRVASMNAKFGQPEVNLGIIPGYGGTQRLTQLVGKGKGYELLMTGDMIGAEEAVSLGLANYAVEQSELFNKCNEIISKIRKKSPAAVGKIVDCVNAVYIDGEDGYQTEANAFGRCCGLEDFKEGTSAFLEKRKPEFTGK